MALYVNDNNVTYFDSFGLEHIPKKNRKLFRNKNMTTNIYRIQTNDSIICRFFCIRHIDFMLKCEGLLECPNLFYEKLILHYL